MSRFGVGDIVSYNNETGHIILNKANPFRHRVKLGCRGIITAFHEDCLSVGEFYSVSWFDGNGNSVNEVIELNPCEGITNHHYCRRCKDKKECRDARK